MTSFAIRDLGWLERPADDWRARVKAHLRGEGSVTSGALMALGRAALNIDQLIQLDRMVQKLGNRLDSRGFTPLKVALMVDGTTDYLAPALRASGVRHGLLIETYAPDYGQALAEAMDPSGPLADFGADVALVASDYRSLGLGTPRIEGDGGAVAPAAQKMGQIVQGCAGKGATPLVQTIPIPGDPWCGHLDAALPGAPAAQVAAVNDALREIATRYGGSVLDADALAANGGKRGAAAESLGISPRTLRYKLARMREAGIAIPGEHDE